MNLLTKLQPVDYLSIGHITLDIEDTGPRIGGTAAYASLTAHAIGFETGIITSWGCEISPGPLNQLRIINKKTNSSTIFKNIQSKNGRTQYIHHVSETLEPALIPLKWRNPLIVHIGPVANEIDPEIINSFPNSMICLTPQGWLREQDHEGKVLSKEWLYSNLYLEKCSAVILSIEDINGDENRINEMADHCKVLVVTEGKKGGRVYWNGDVRRYKGLNLKEVDSTGSGDIFAASFFIQYHKTRNPWEAARFANQLAGVSTTRIGLLSIPRNKEILEARSEVF